MKALYAAIWACSLLAMKALYAAIWACSLLAMIVGCSSAAETESVTPFSVIPDLPAGWQKAGPSSLVVLVVVLFLVYLHAENRRRSHADSKQVEHFGSVARELSDKFCGSIAAQQEHCKNELTMLTDGFRNHIEDLKAARTDALKRLPCQADNSNGKA